LKQTLEVTPSENFGRCPRCGQFLVAEQKKAHKCNFADRPIEGCEEIVLDRLSDAGEDKNGDHLHLAWGVDNMLYRLLVCKHNPPHGINTKRPPDNATVYPPGGVTWSFESNEADFAALW
jgi:hypothetical protein